MAKAHDSKPSTQKVIAVFREEGAYGLMEIEIEKEVLLKHGKITWKSEADIFAIFITQLTKRARDLFGI